LEGERIPPGVAALVGGGVHSGIEMNMRQKLQTRMDMPPSRIVEAARAGLDQRLSDEGVTLSDEERGRGQGVVLGEAADRCVEFAQHHATRQAPCYQPVLVEHRVTLELPGHSHDFVGVIDLADEDDMVIDFKTGRKKRSQKEADLSFQLTGYAAMFHRVKGYLPSMVALDCLTKTAKGVDRHLLGSHRTEDDLEAIAHRIDVTARAMQSGAFVGANPATDWHCSPRWCGYWRTCKFIPRHLRNKT
jgi:hypothetical protein